MVTLFAPIILFQASYHFLFIYILQSYMDSEIRAIMAQYMPLDNQAENPNHIPQHANIWELNL